MMATTSYQHALEAVTALPEAEQKALLREVSQKLEAPERPLRRITELKGLGKEIWKGIDAQEYVRQERESWRDRER